MPRDESTNDDVHLTVKKIFIGRIRDGLDENSLKTYFEKYGTINDCRVMHDQNGKTRGFAFIEFDGKLKFEFSNKSKIDSFQIMIPWIKSFSHVLIRSMSIQSM